MTEIAGTECLVCGWRARGEHEQCESGWCEDGGEVVWESVKYRRTVKVCVEFVLNLEGYDEGALDGVVKSSFARNIERAGSEVLPLSVSGSDGSWRITGARVKS